MKISILKRDKRQGELSQVLAQPVVTEICLLGQKLPTLCVYVVNVFKKYVWVKITHLSLTIVGAKHSKLL